MPVGDRDCIGPIVVAVDTSGSIGDKELEQFAGEISAICDDAKPEVVHVVYCDSAVQSSQQFESSEPIHLEPKGGGGTDFCAVFEWVEENQIAPVCLIYLTDLCCHSYPQLPAIILEPDRLTHIRLDLTTTHASVRINRTPSARRQSSQWERPDAIASGPVPTEIVATTTRSATRIADTVLEPELATYAVFPSGDIVISTGREPT